MKITTTSFRITVLAPTLALPAFQWFVSHAGKNLGQGHEATHPQAKKAAAIFRAARVIEAKRLLAPKKRIP